MIRSLLAATSLTAALVAAGSAFTPSPAATPQPAFWGPGGVHEMHLKLFRALDSGDKKAVREFFAENTAGIGIDEKGNFGKPRGFEAFVLDSKGQPRACDDIDCVVECLTDWGEKGWTTRITDGWMDCPTDRLSYATLEFERTCRTGDGVETRKYRSTSLVRHTKSGFKLWHLHLSPAG